MKRIIILTLGLLPLVSFSLFSQNKEMSIVYKMSHRFYEEMKSLNEDIMVLDISDKQSFFYCPLYERRKDVRDSLLKAGYNAFEIQNELSKRKLKGSSSSLNVLKNYPTNGVLTLSDIILDPFLYEESMPNYDWSLEDLDTIVAGYTCYKACMSYRGRDWTAFYTMDIPVSDGPWKLCGLPGLILYARDSRSDFIFDCVGISNGNNRSIKLRDINYKRCSAREMMELFKLNARDEDALMYRLWGTKVLSMTDANGRPVKNVPKTACLMEIIKTKDD